MDTHNTSAELAIELKAATTKEQISAVANKAIEALAAGEQVVAGSLDQVTEMGKRLDLLEKNRTGANVLVKIDGVDYKIVGNKFHSKGVKEPITAEELAKDEQRCRGLIEKGSGSFIKLSDEPVVEI